MPNIVLPQNWSPRWYQVNLFGRLDRGSKRECCVWHRRAGKDVSMVNYAAMSAMKRVGTYWHVYPTQKQARKAIWEGITSSGQRILDQAFPGFKNPKSANSIVARTRDDDMMIELKNGAIWRLVGGDAYDGLVGSNVVGCVFSEFAIMDPRAWDYVRPILLESDGWCVFISTPRGHNHWHRLCQMAKREPDWHYELLTFKHTGAFTEAQIEAERRSGMPEEKIKQEYYCDFEAANVGSIYGEEIQRLKLAGRVGSVPYNRAYPVETAWDIGVVNETAIWFYQQIGSDIHVIDHFAEPSKGKGLPYFLNKCREKGYAYSRHIGPHDFWREWIGNAETPAQVAMNHGFYFTPAPKLAVETGIEMTRTLMPRFKFDEGNCQRGIEALEDYEYEYDDELRIYKDTPAKHWGRDRCDAKRMFCQTPLDFGKVPDWAVKAGMGHNGGPPMDKPSYKGVFTPQEAQGGGYDPLSQFR